jgi:eukaryotic-like serine/threonine-protein kinase
MPPSAGAAARSIPPRSLGRFVLRQLLGKSERTMVWLATDPRTGQDLMLWLPRVQPADALALDTWTGAVRAAARLDHPRLAHTAEIGVAEQWPYLCIDRALGVTLGEWLAEHPTPAPDDAAAWLADALDGLAFAHEAGVVHGDVQPHTLLVDPQGRLCAAALAVGQDTSTAAARGPSGLAVDPAALRARRDGAQRDLLGCGLLLHRLLAGEPALGEADIALAIDRMPPLGRDTVRLPWTTPHSVPEALRAIADRASTAVERLRYLHARSLLRAINGWRSAHAEDRGGALALLIDRLHSVGHLPAMPGAMARVSALSGVADAQRLDELAAQVVDDMALTLELLRMVNSAQVQATQAPGNGAVLTIRRAIALVGVDGLRRAANALRVWPGPLSPTGAATLQQVMELVRLAGYAAQALRPAGYDAEVVYLVAMLQNLGRLLVQYHFPDEAEQIRLLMQPEPPADGAEPGAPQQPGLSESVAAQAVLGTDVESIGAAAARHWGLGDEIQHLIRRLAPNSPVRNPDDDLDVLRITASAANEAVDAVEGLPPQRVGAALDAVAHRYARALKIDGKTLREAVHAARAAQRSGAPVAAQAAESKAA